MSNLVKTIAEFFPIALFFIIFKMMGIYEATIAIIVGVVISFLIQLIYYKKASAISVASSLVIIICAAVTLISGDSKFIKMKPTMLNLLFSSAIFYFAFVKKQGVMKRFFNDSIKMSEEKWLVFSKRWGFFFLSLAIINELVWRNFSENAWVNFKVFGILSMTLIFILSQLPFLLKNGQQQ
jgi:intracellular septation protein